MEEWNKSSWKQFPSSPSFLSSQHSFRSFKPLLYDKLIWHPGSDKGYKEVDPMTKIALLSPLWYASSFICTLGVLPSFILIKEREARINHTNKNAILCATVISEGNAPLAMNFSGLLQTSPGRKMTLDSKCNLFLLNVPVAHFLTTNLMLYISYSAFSRRRAVINN